MEQLQSRELMAGDVFQAAIPAVAATDALHGDANSDDIVDFADFLKLSGNFGEAGSWEQGDFTNDGNVGFEDFLKLSGNFGVSKTEDPPEAPPLSHEIVDDVLEVRGSNQDDVIQIRSTDSYFEVSNGNGVVAQYDKAGIVAIEVFGNEGHDEIDLSGVDETDAFIYGGQGNDTLVGGGGDDLVLGMQGDDEVSGGAGHDVLYGGMDLNEVTSVDGQGEDFVLVATGLKATESDSSLAKDDTDIEAMSYEDRTYFELFHKFRDAHGFVITLDENGITERGDAALMTGMAVATAALRGDGEAVTSLLETIRDKQFVHERGRLRLIRHPDVFDYVMRSGVSPDDFVEDGDNSDMVERERRAPLTKDGVVGIMSGIYYAFKADGLDDNVRGLAKEVMGKLLDYLIDNQWKTVDEYPEHYWKTDGDRFTSVFDENGNRIQKKSVEGYLISPSDRYALKNIASEMGFAVGHWNVWTDFALTATKLLGEQYYDQVVKPASDAVAKWAGSQVDAFLKKISVHEEISFHVIPGVDWTKVSHIGGIPLKLDIELSGADRQNIVAVFETGVREYVKTLIGGYSAKATGVGANVGLGVAEFNDMLGRTVDKMLDALPSWAEADRWRPAIVDSLQTAFAWLNLDSLGEIAAFRLSHELAKLGAEKGDDYDAKQVKSGDLEYDSEQEKGDISVVHLSFWPTLMLFETRSEMVDILGLSVHDLDAHLTSFTHDYTNNRTDPPEFWDRHLRRSDMMLYKWLDGDSGAIETWLNNFETDRRYDNLSFTWKQDRHENVHKILTGDSEGKTDSGHHRLDYLLLKELHRRGTPESASEQVGDWLRHWRDTLSDLGNQSFTDVKEFWDDLRSDPVKFAKELVAKFNPSLDRAVKALFREFNDLGDVASGIYHGMNVKDLGKLTKSLYQNTGGTGKSITNLAKAIYKNTGSAGKNVGRLAGALWDVTHDVNGIAKALYHGLGRDTFQIAGDLYKGTSMGYKNVAKALYHGLGRNTFEVAADLYNGAGMGNNNVAKAL